MRNLLFTLLLLLTITSQGQELTTGGKLKPEQAIMDVRHYTITLSVNVEQQAIEGNTVIDVIMAQPTKTLIFDLLDSFNVAKVLVNNVQQPFAYKNNLITISMDKSLPIGKATVQVFYGGKPHIAKRPPWDDGFTWTKDVDGIKGVEITAEGIGGKIFFPCKDHPSDEPNEGAELIITVPANLVVAGPGVLKSDISNGNTRTFHWKTTYTINNYSILFNAANYVVVTRPYTTVAGNTVPIQFYVMKRNLEKAAHHLDIFEKTIRVQEKYFGEYPWVKEKIGIVETTHLGMEHQTMNAYGAKFRYSKVGGEDFDGLMHHEFGHEWWGNKVTAKDWADFWIHEGICTFGDALFVREVEGETAYINRFKQSVKGIGNVKPLVLGKDIDGKTAYNGDIYSKGAFFMHTLRFVMGDALFFPALKKFVTSKEYTYDNLANTGDVEKFFSKQAKQNLKPLFDLYVRSVNKLEITVKALPNNRYSVALTNIKMPLPVEILTDKGVERKLLSVTPTIITSKQAPEIDPDVYYITKISVK